MVKEKPEVTKTIHEFVSSLVDYYNDVFIELARRSQACPWILRTDLPVYFGVPPILSTDDQIKSYGEHIKQMHKKNTLPFPEEECVLISWEPCGPLLGAGSLGAMCILPHLKSHTRTVRYRSEWKEIIEIPVMYCKNQHLISMPCFMCYTDFTNALKVPKIISQAAQLDKLNEMARVMHKGDDKKLDDGRRRLKLYWDSIHDEENKTFWESGQLQHLDSDSPAAVGMASDVLGILSAFTKSTNFTKLTCNLGELTRP